MRRLMPFKFRGFLAQYSLYYCFSNSPKETIKKFMCVKFSFTFYWLSSKWIRSYLTAYYCASVCLICKKRNYCFLLNLIPRPSRTLKTRADSRRGAGRRFCLSQYLRVIRHVQGINYLLMARIRRCQISIR